MTSRSIRGALPAVLLAAGAATAQAPAPRPAPPAGGFELEVRGAAVTDVLEQLGAATRTRLEAGPGFERRRVSIYAPRAGLASIQAALAGLYRGSWIAAGQDGMTQRLQVHARLADEAEELRRERRRRMLDALLATEAQLRGRGDPASVAKKLRFDVARRLPQVAPGDLDDLSAEFLGQAVVLAPLRYGLRDAFVKHGVVLAYLSSIPDPLRSAMQEWALFRQAALPVREDGSSVGPEILTYGQARVEYRAIYGDRWSGPLLLARIGASDHWSEARFPAVLYPLPDDLTLYPPTTLPAGDRLLDAPTQLTLDTNRLTWEQALLEVARAAGIGVLSDAPTRPWVFRPGLSGPVLTGRTYHELLQKAADYYGYAAWRAGDFYLLRNRYWAEEEAVDLPNALWKQLGSAASGVTDEAIGGLAELDENQLLTLHLHAAAEGRPQAPAVRFDLNEMQAVRAGLMIYASMTPSQRREVRSGGVPYVSLDPPQQRVFSAVGLDRGLPLQPADQRNWGLRFSADLRRERLPQGWAVLGSLRVTFDFGAAGRRRAEVGIRAPAPPPSREQQGS